MITLRDMADLPDGIFGISNQYNYEWYYAKTGNKYHCLCYFAENLYTEIVENAMRDMDEWHDWILSYGPAANLITMERMGNSFEKLCNCSIANLMIAGCKCGGI